MSGGNDAVRFFASGDIDNETGPIQMQEFERRALRFDAHARSQRVVSPRGAAARVVPRQSLRATLSPKFDLSLTSGFTKLDNRIPPESDLDHRAVLRRHAELRLQGMPRRQLPVRTRQGSIPGRRRSASRRASVGAGRHHAGDAELRRAAFHRQRDRQTGVRCRWMQNEGTAGLDLAAVDFFHAVPPDGVPAAERDGAS